MSEAISASAPMVQRLTFDAISFSYRRPRLGVFNSLSWAVPAGRTVLLGPNGAGKTTLLALAADYLKPDAGQIRLGSLVSARRRDRSAYRRAVGWMPQHVRAVAGLSVREQTAYAGWLKGLSTPDAWQRSIETLREVGLDDLADRKASTLSGGQLRRLGLAQVLVHSAEVLLLDEPTAGLDPSQRARFRDTLTTLPRRQATVVSTHQVDDLSDLFDTVVVIRAGRLRFEGSVEQFLTLAPPGATRRAEVAYASIVSGDD